MKKIALLMSAASLFTVDAGSVTEAAGCNTTKTITLTAKVKYVDKTRWGDRILIAKTKGECSVDHISLEHSAPGRCVAGAIATASGKYELVDMAGLVFEATNVRCQ